MYELEDTSQKRHLYTKNMLTCLLTGICDLIACSILVGEVPTQNSGYKGTRLRPLLFRLFLFLSSNNGSGQPSPPSKIHPGPLPFSEI